MESLNISTTQNIDLEFKRASIGDRIFAYGFDYLIMSSWVLLWLFIFSKVGGDFEFWQLLFTIPIVFYSLACELFMNGQSLGKLIFKIKVVKLDGSEVKLSDCLIRWVMRLVDIWISMGMVGIPTLILSKNSQRVGDMLAKTTVIKLTKKDFFSDTSYIEVPESYIPKYSQSVNLSDEDVRIIKEVLSIHHQELVNSKSSNGRIFLKKTHEAIKEKLNITDTSEPPKVFLENVVKDYNYYHR